MGHLKGFQLRLLIKNLHVLDAKKKKKGNAILLSYLMFCICSCLKYYTRPLCWLQSQLSLLRVYKLPQASFFFFFLRRIFFFFSLLYLHQLVWWVSIKITENFQPCLAAHIPRDRMSYIVCRHQCNMKM